MSVGVAAVGLGDAEGEIDELGDTDALGLTEAEADRDADTEGLTDAEGLTEADGLIEAEAEREADTDGLTLALAEMDGERLVLGERDAEAETDAETDGDNDALGLCEGEAEAEVDGEADRDADSDGLVLGDGLRLSLGLTLALGLTEAEMDREAEALGLTDGEADADPDTLGLTEADVETDAETLGLRELVPPGFVTSFRICPENFVARIVSGNDPSLASATHVKVRRRTWPMSDWAWMIEPATGYASSIAYVRMKSTCVAVSISLPVWPTVIAVFASHATNESPSAKTAVPATPGRLTSLWVSWACANANSFTLDELCVPRMSTVVTVPAAPPTAMARQSIRRYWKPGRAASNVAPAMISAMVLRKR